MSDILDKPITLKLNSLWQRIGWATPRQAFTALCGGAYGGTPPALALAITTDENGELVDAVPMNWEEWIKLPVRPQDFGISYGKGQVRVPSVIISPVYSGMPIKRRQLNLKAIRERDGNKCQISGKTLAEGEGNLGHIVARSKGGARSWENLVYMDKRINTIQGTATPEELGWKLLSEPRAPLPAPASFAIRESKMEDHKPFIK